MIELIENLPTGCIGAEAKGYVTGEDYKSVLIPRFEAELKEKDKVNFLYVLGPEFEGFDVDAMWQDTKIGLANYFSFNKIGLVSDTAWVRGVASALGLLIPAEIKVFPCDQLEEAKGWLSS